MTNTECAKLIKQSVNIKTATELYGLAYDRSESSLCPFHSEKTPSFRVKNDYFHCFGCGAGGDVIKFVMMMFGIDFKEAMAKLNKDFSLGLPLGGKLSLRQACEAQNRIRQIQTAQSKAKEEQAAKDSLYWSLWDEWMRLDVNKRNYAPKSPDEPLHPLFIEALYKIDYQMYLIDSTL